jgi:hypothetical protein
MWEQTESSTISNIGISCWGVVSFANRLLCPPGLSPRYPVSRGECIQKPTDILEYTNLCRPCIDSYRDPSDMHPIAKF